MHRSASAGSRRATRIGAAVAFLALSLAFAGAWRGRGRVMGWLALRSPEAQVRDALGRLDRLRFSVADATVELQPVRFSDVVAAAEDGRATAIALVEADGRVAWPGGGAALAYVGRERLRLAPCRTAGWCAEAGAPLERLPGVLAALLAEARRDPGAKVLAWQIRVERDAAEVGEDRERAGDGARGDRERRLHRLAREAERWVFTGG